MRVHLRKKDILGYMCLALATVLILALISARQCATDITVRYYAVSTDKIAEPLRVIQLSDLHSHVFGNNNDVLASTVAGQRPDLIVMTGDMLDKQDEDADAVCELIQQLQQVSPVYYCHGNHEKQWMAETGIDLNPQLTQAGATVLDTQYLDILLKGQPLRIGGYHGYYRQPGMFPVTKQQAAAELTFAETFETAESFKLLLCHIPTAWLDWGYIDKFPVDLVLTGHNHGGQIRLPLIGGLAAPYVGLFPDYTEGIFCGTQATCILSTGLGSSPGIPRINNPPQIVVIDILPQT